MLVHWIAMLAWLSAALLMPAATLDDGSVVILQVNDATDQQGYWSARVQDRLMSVEYSPGVEGGSSTGTWSATVQQGQVVPTLQPPDTPEDPLQPAQLSAAPSQGAANEAAGSTSDDEVQFTVSLGRFALVKKPRLDHDSARRYCEDAGGHLVIFEDPEELAQLRDLMDMYLSDQDVDAFIDMSNGYGRPLEWSASEIPGKACLAIVKSGELFLRPCANQLSFFCAESNGTTPASDTLP